MTNVVTAISKLADVLRSKGMNLRQLKDFLNGMESEYGDALRYTDVHWLSRGWLLQSMCNLKSEFELFVEMKGKPFFQVCDHNWMCDFAFCIDIIQHMIKLNVNLI
jgi:hypothetical protein